MKNHILLFAGESHHQLNSDMPEAHFYAPFLPSSVAVPLFPAAYPFPVHGNLIGDNSFATEASSLGMSGRLLYFSS